MHRIRRAVPAALLLLGTACASTAVAAPTGPDDRSRIGIAAEALRDDPVYISPHLEAGLLGDSDRVRAAAKRLGLPVHVAVSPVWEGDGTGNGSVYVPRLHEQLGEDGVYVLVDQNGAADVRAYGVRPKGDPRELAPGLRDYRWNERATLADTAVAALTGLRTGTVPEAPPRPEESATTAAADGTDTLSALAAGFGVLVAVLLGLAHRFTDLPLWPRRRDAESAGEPAPDWRTAPDPPKPDRDTLSALARRYDETLETALTAAGRTRLGEDRLPYREQLAAADLIDTWDRPAEERGAAHPMEITALAASVELSRAGLRALAALRAGEEPRPEPPCFHNPLHERGAARAPHPAPPPGAEPPPRVAVCARCATEGRRPLSVPSDSGEPVPYYASESVGENWRMAGFGAADPEDPVETLLNAVLGEDGAAAETADEDGPVSV